MERTAIDLRESVTLPPGPASIRAAREHVSSMLAREIDAVAVEQAVLLVSELATNAVLHARTSFTVRVDVEADRVRVTVHDGSPVPPVLRTPEPLAPNGRGMHIVDSTARRWGSERIGAGKAVWFELER